MKLHRLALVAPISSLVLLATIVGCGKGDATDIESQVRWTPIAGTTRAILEERDFKDEFVFGMRVVSTKGMNNAALTMDVRPMRVRLKEFSQRAGGGRDPSFPPGFDPLAATQSGAKELRIVPVGGEDEKSLLSFALRNSSASRAGTRGEVDFGSTSLLKIEADRFASRAGSFGAEEGIVWSTQGAKTGKVLKLEQQADFILVDVEYPLIKYSSLSGNPIGAGSITVRMYLKRRASTRLSAAPSVQAARSNSIGFFGSQFGATLAAEGALPIARHPLDVRARESRTVYLKDFPSDMVATATNAIKAWNVGFGYEAFKVESAPASVDIGDPRYSVVKWHNGLTNEVGWAGYAPQMSDPVHGETFAAQILINGSSTRSDIEKLAAYTSQAAPEFGTLKGSFGAVPLVQGAGESPVVTFFTDPAEKDPKKFMQAYYYSVIMHEFGHSLGLRHNFAASTKLDADGTASSVMDYEPNFIANKRKNIGSYDLAAIRFGYFGERPTSKLAFCTDENLRYSYYCNQGDLGDPATYAAASAINGASFLAKSGITLPVHVDKPMMGAIKNLYSLEAKAKWSDKCGESSGPLATSVANLVLGAQSRLEAVVKAGSVSDPVRANLARLQVSFLEGTTEGRAITTQASCTIERAPVVR